MARPRTPVGTYGAIHTERVSDHTWEARTRFRSASGRMLRPRRRGRTKRAAEAALKDHLLSLAEEAGRGHVTPRTRLARIAELWLEEIARQAEQGGIEASTHDQYARRVSYWIVPTLGELDAREVTVRAADDLIQKARRHSYASAKGVRVVLRGICSYAVRHGAMTQNPVDGTARLTQGRGKEIAALDAHQRADLLAKLAEYTASKAVDSVGRELGPRHDTWADLPELVEAMLSTGCRIGEVLAVTGEDIDPGAGTVRLDHHVVRVKGEGLVRSPYRKGGRAGITLRVPQWSLPMWRRRKLASGGGPLFAAWRGGWLDPTNVQKRLRSACDEIGYGWVTSHVFRRTVATHLGESSLPSHAIADQLGNTTALVEGHYRRPAEANEATAQALESIMDRSKNGP